MENASGMSNLSLRDATICSTDNSYASMVGGKSTKQEETIKAYVDFTEFNKNYAHYLKKHGLSDSDDDDIKAHSRSEIISSDSVDMIATRKESHSSVQSDDWEVLNW